jgi:hypothetical protein
LVGLTHVGRAQSAVLISPRLGCRTCRARKVSVVTINLCYARSWVWPGQMWWTPRAVWKLC